MFSNLAILISSFQIKLASFCVSDGSGNPFGYWAAASPPPNKQKDWSGRSDPSGCRSAGEGHAQKKITQINE